MKNIIWKFTLEFFFYISNDYIFLSILFWSTLFQGFQNYKTHISTAHIQWVHVLILVFKDLEAKIHHDLKIFHFCSILTVTYPLKQTLDNDETINILLVLLEYWGIWFHSLNREKNAYSCRYLSKHFIKYSKQGILIGFYESQS